MDRILRPERLQTDPNSSNARKEFSHWLRTFKNFLSSLSPKPNEKDKLTILINHISPDVDEYVSNCEKYDDAIKTLENLYIKPANEVFSRHKLATRHQQHDESIDEFIQALKILSKDCQFKDVTADQNRDDYVRDAFITGLKSTCIRQRLLEKTTLKLEDAYDQARSLELAFQQSMSFSSPRAVSSISSVNNEETKHNETDNIDSAQTANKGTEHSISAVTIKCFFCGNFKHPRIKCPARNITCFLCGKQGHFSKVCRNSQNKESKPNAQNHSSNFIGLAATTGGLAKSTVFASVNNETISALIDTGSSLSFINEAVAIRLKLPITPATGRVSMASTVMTSSIMGQCKVNLKLLNHCYGSVNLSLLPNLCSDIIIGHDILKRHSSVQLVFGGKNEPLKICSVASASVQPATLFANLKPDCKPLAVKSIRHSISDLKYIENEVHTLLKEDVIEPSNSPWRAQVLVVGNENEKKRMVIDYSRTINRFTLLDAYPLPRVDEIVNKVANYEHFSTIDLKSAYHQVPIKEEERFYTAFEACGRLYQFKRIPFGVTNGVSAFQRVIDGLIHSENLKDTYAYLDDVTICGKTQAEHNENLSKFMEVAKKYNLTINKEKSSFGLRTINLLGYHISNKTIKPDPGRLEPLKNLPPPKDMASLRRALGMFSHYSSHIPNFSSKLALLTKTNFPLNETALKAFDGLKADIENAMVRSIDPTSPFIVETDASDKSIAATLSQLGRPVAFFSRILSGSELKHSSVEKEAQAIVEALRKWRHFLIGQHFKLITDQRSVSFMFDNNRHGKVKNDKIMRWRMELSSFQYDIVYRPGSKNAAADAFSRMCYAISDPITKLQNLHISLCHPGVTRFYHWVKSKNLPFSIEEVRRVVTSCKTCASVKPRFHKHHGTLIKATAPFERLNIDFKGPLPSTNKNRFLLVIIDEYSRYPFAYPCLDMSSTSVIECLKNLFSMFGTPAYIHSDQGTSFQSHEVKQFLNSLGVATSRSTPYNPAGNGQVERYNSTLWTTIQLALHTMGLKLCNWQSVLAEALHSIRSLLCTTTNTSPHERMFKHPRRSGVGVSAPSWLLTPGPVLLKRMNRTSKYEPIVDEVTLLHGNAEYAHVQLLDGREVTVSTRYLAPVGESNITGEENQIETDILEDANPIRNEYTSQEEIVQPTSNDVLISGDEPSRNARTRRQPAYLRDYVL